MSRELSRRLLFRAAAASRRRPKQRQVSALQRAPTIHYFGGGGGVGDGAAVFFLGLRSVWLALVHSARVAASSAYLFRTMASSFFTITSPSAINSSIDAPADTCVPTLFACCLMAASKLAMSVFR